VLVEFHDFAALVTPRSQLVIGDGVPRFGVVSVADGDVHTRALSRGEVLPRKGINVTYARPELPALTEKDIADLQLAAELGADFIALSFVRSAADLEQLRAMLHAAGASPRIIAKIEKIEAYENLDGIIAVSDGLMVARGDYGRGGGRGPRAAHAEGHDPARDAGGQVRHHRHADARVDDPGARAHACGGHRRGQRGDRRVLGGDALGRDERRRAPDRGGPGDGRDRARRRGVRPSSTAARKDVVSQTVAEAVLHAAVELADEVDAAALVLPTSTGNAARACAKWRRGGRSSRSTHLPRVAEKLSLEWGVYAASMQAAGSVDEMIDHALHVARDFADLPVGARVVLTAVGAPGTPGATNLVMVREIP
jgi:pyruvate kinase